MPPVMSECRHTQRVEGRCVACGHCVHEVILNGACFICGTTDIDPVAISPKRQQQPPPLIPPERLTKK